MIETLNNFTFIINTLEPEKCLLLNLTREEIERQQAQNRFKKMHAEGKTEQAQKDLARLAIIRKQREEAARKREEQKKGKIKLLFLVL